MRYLLILLALVAFPGGFAHATGIHSTKLRTSHAKVGEVSKDIEAPAPAPRAGTVQHPAAR